jgi:pantoate--beta-alanine ligase
VNRVETIGELRLQLAVWRGAGERTALVPTMGNLHAGHLELVLKARDLADRVVVSIFVNPMQFSAGEDLDAYPRTLDEDIARLTDAGADLLFQPSEAEIYRRPLEGQTRVEVPGISDILCGVSRPGHFVGVATVVCKLFNMTQPSLALFGEKDYQQLLVIRRMTEDLCMPVEIRGVPTVREEDGLALSSRNNYLSPDERARAPAMYRMLRETANAIIGGARDYRRLEQTALSRLTEAGLKPDYFVIRRAEDLGAPMSGEEELVILAAAYVGRARLIDNLRLSLR